MKILDINGNEITNPDLSLGYLQDEKLLVAHHDAVPEVQEQWHYIYGITQPDGTFVEGQTYASGGRDAVKVIDVPGQEAKEAWDEYEDIQRYIEYTPEELEEQEEIERKISEKDLTLELLADHEERICIIELNSL